MQNNIILQIMFSNNMIIKMVSRNLKTRSHFLIIFSSILIRLFDKIKMIKTFK